LIHLKIVSFEEFCSGGYPEKKRRKFVHKKLWMEARIISLASPLQQQPVES